MSKYILFSILFTFSISGFAQTNVLDQKELAIQPNIRGRLIELAVQNPNLEIADHKVKIAKYNLKSAKGWWINNVSLSFNANEFTIKRLAGQKPSTGQYYPYYPFYNVGVNIPIGGIFTQPAKVKAAREEVAIAQNQRNNQYRNIKAAVLSAYEDYLSNKKLFTLQMQITESSYNEFLQAKQKFRNGAISLLDYNAASEAYHNQLKNEIGVQHDLNLNKINLEALIGVPLNTVLPNLLSPDRRTDSLSSQTR